MLLYKKVTCDKCKNVFELNKKSTKKKCPKCGETILALNDPIQKRKKVKLIPLDVKTCYICGEDANVNYGNGLCTDCYYEEIHDSDLIIFQEFCEKVSLCKNL